MSRRVSLPGASELFRATHAADQPPVEDTRAEQTRPHGSRPEQGRPEPTGRDGRPPKGRGSGRVRHDEKITIYVSAEELLALEQARLTLRARHNTAVDRGRIVREAIAATLADLDARAGDSELVRRLSAP